MAISLGTTTITALFLGTTSISSAYLGATQVFGGSFTPLSLYSSGAQGIWLDPSDLTTMFSDRAGTTPVTTPGTVVGLRLDKSKGLALGAELVTNGGFATDTSWTKGTSTVISGGSATSTAQTGLMLEQAGYSFVVGKTYEIRLDVSAYSAGGVNIRVGNNTLNSLTGVAANGSYVFRFAVTNIATQTFSLFSSGTTSATIDNISVRELAGNHAVAPTDAARPIYGVEPKGGRRNLLTWSEGFDNAVWTKRASTASGGTITATASSGDHDVTQTVTTSGSTVTASVLVKSGTSTFAWITLSPTFGLGNYATAVANLATGVITKTQSGGTLTGATAGISGPDAQGFYRVTLSAANPTTSMTVIVGISNSATPTVGGYGNVDFTAVGTETIITGGAQLELGSTATAYQRVTTAYDVTESGVATCHYVQYDGSDDSMSTAAIDFTATDKMSVFAGVFKLTDAVSESVFIGLGNGDIGSALGFEIQPTAFASSPKGFGIQSMGQNYASGFVNSLLAPVTRVFTGTLSRGQATSAATFGMRLNGVGQSLSYSTTALPTGNFGNLPMFFGRRNDSRLPFNGKDFGIIVVGKTASAGEISDTETWLAARTAQVTL